ncbi:MAG: hypothetical protein ACLR2G_12425 [Phascolarctobacterium faecium]
MSEDANALLSWHALNLYCGLIIGDQGMEAARVFLLGLMKAELDFICTHGICSDFKTRLQEVAQQMAMLISSTS